MHLDGFFFTCLTADLNKFLPGSRVEDVYDTVNGSVALQFRAPGRTLRLEISIQSPPLAFFLTDQGNRSSTSGVFSQTLKKHLNGLFCVDAKNPPFDRLAVLSFAASPDGNAGTYVYIELMGRQNDIILCQGDSILTSTRPPKRDSSRPLQPGDHYLPPPTAGKILPNQITAELLQTLINNIGAISIQAALVKTVFGVSPLLAREICHRAGVLPDDQELAATDLTELVKIIHALAQDSLAGNISPVVYQDSGIGPYWTRLLSAPGAYREFDSLSAAVSQWSMSRKNHDRLLSQKARLNSALSASLDKAKRTLTKQELERARAKDFSRLREVGDTLLAYINSVPRGATSVTLNNVYTGDAIAISLNPEKSVSANAAQYFKKYSKYKNAQEIVEKQIEMNRRLLEYLDSLEYALESADSLDDCLQIQAEMEEQGLIRKQVKTKRPLSSDEFLSFNTPQGDIVLVGKNNKQNEELTLRKAKKDHYWLHSRHFPGSHVILCTSSPEESALEFAASLAAWHSKGRSAPKVEIVWTQVKNVKKIPGAKPGMVQYSDYRSAFIEPRSQQGHG